MLHSNLLQSCGVIADEECAVSGSDQLVVATHLIILNLWETNLYKTLIIVTMTLCEMPHIQTTVRIFDWCCAVLQVAMPECNDIC